MAKFPSVSLAADSCGLLIAARILTLPQGWVVARVQRCADHRYRVQPGFFLAYQQGLQFSSRSDKVVPVFPERRKVDMLDHEGPEEKRRIGREIKKLLAVHGIDRASPENPVREDGG